MAKTIGVTVTDEAHENLCKVQDRMTELRQVKNPAASAVNQHDALTWVLEHTALPLTLES